MMPGDGYLDVELNAWHTSKRGSHPAGYSDDPDSTYSDNEWGFPVTSGTETPGVTEPLKAGDYVIVTGTLWEDIAHLKSTPNRIRSCYNSVFNGQGGWLEIHPVDVLRHAVPPPLPRRHPELVTVCALSGLTDTTGLTVSPDDDPQDANSTLRFQEMIDSRFTNSNSVTADQVQVDPCDPTKLDVFVSVTAPKDGFGYYKSLVLTWWEESKTPRPPANQSCALSSAQSDLRLYLHECVRGNPSGCLGINGVDP